MFMTNDDTNLGGDKFVQSGANQGRPLLALGRHATARHVLERELPR